MDGDAIYFDRRATEERVAAMKAADPRARRAHLKMAETYGVRADAIVAREPPITEKAS